MTPSPDLTGTGTGLIFADMKYKILDPEEDCRCLECGSAMSGRPDKKYCSTRCKNRHNNRRRDLASRYERITMNNLWHNHRILEFYILKGSTSARMDELEELGFITEAVTGCGRGKNGHSQLRCFDIVYYQSAKKIFNIHREPVTSSLPEKSS